MTYKHEIKPNKTVFVYYRFILGAVNQAIIMLIFYSLLNIILKGTGWYFIGYYLISEIYRIISLHVQYNKTKYIFLTNRMIRHTGGIFSDNETELVVRNITHVTMSLPWLQNMLFGTGSISIQSAGAAGAEIGMSSIDHPKGMYEYVEKLMHSNGFSLKKKHLIQEASPSALGVTFETIRNFFVSLFAVLVLGGGVLGKLLEGKTALARQYWWVGVIISGIILFLVLLFNAFHFLDLIKRKYKIYDDALTYKEGFLSKNYSFIPVENLADSEATRTLIDKIFGLYDIKISCQGTSHEIHFKNIREGQLMEKNIDSLTAKAKPLIGTHKEAKHITAKKLPHHKAATPIEADRKFTGHYMMDGRRTVIPLIVFTIISLVLGPIFLVAVFMLIGSLIKMYYTTYNIKHNSIEERYNFLTTKNKEFTLENITGIIIKESFIDKWFGTMTVVFWSIGSSNNIIFRNIKKTDELIKSIISKSGIKKEEEIYKSFSDFSIGDMIKANLITIGLMIAVYIAFFVAIISFPHPLLIIPPILFTLILATVIIYLFAFYKRSKMHMYKDHVYFKKGIFFKSFYYVLYKNVKDITITKYPFTMHGKLQFNVAGETLVQKGQNNQPQMVSNAFHISFIPNIDVKDEIIDMVFYSRPSADKLKHIEENIKDYTEKQPVVDAKPDLANSLIGLLWLLIITIIIIPISLIMSSGPAAKSLILIIPVWLVIALGITIYVIWSVKVKSYIIEDYRVIEKWGILYKSQQSIVFNKIDHINKSQGMVNKMFNNGNITINTTGSSKPEISIYNIPNYVKFYEKLKEYY